MEIPKIYKNISLIIFCIFLLLIILCEETAARTYYVATNGSDTNDGSINAPFRTIQKAANVVGPGDKVIVKAGTYFERIEIKTSGTPGNPIVFEGERGPSDEFLTIIDGGDRVTGWVPAPEVGSGVYKTTSIGYTPGNMVVDDKQIPQIGSNAMNNGKGFVLLSKSINTMVDVWYFDLDVKFWDVFSVIWGYKDGYTYIRFKDGDNPNQKNLRSSPVGTTVTISGEDYNLIRNFKIQAGSNAVKLSNAEHNTIEECYLMNGTRRVYITNGASYNKIRNCQITMNFSGFVQPGMWDDKARNNYNLALKGYIYNFYKSIVSDQGGSKDYQVFIGNFSEDGGEYNEISGSHIFQGLIGLWSFHNRNLKFFNNRIYDHSSIGLFPMQGTLEAEIYDNLVFNNNINMRFHDMNLKPHRKIYIYRNRFYLPPNAGDHIFTHWRTGTSSSGYIPPTFYLYHNSFSGGVAVITLDNDGLNYGGSPNLHFLNNIFSSKTSFMAVEDYRDDESMLGTYDYNWVGGSKRYSSNPAWFGSHNIEAYGQKFWDDSKIPDFSIPTDSPARNAGIDLSKPFTIDGKTFDPLPGMEPGYAGPDGKPDMGAINQPTSGSPDKQAPTIPTNLVAQVISSSQIDLRWSASTDNRGVSGYHIYRDGNKITSTYNTNYSDIDLSYSTTYTYTVSAYDFAGNESAQSTPASATTHSVGEPVYTTLKAPISPIVDGDLTEYAHTNAINFSPSTGGNHVTIKALWDSVALYFGYEVTDTELDATETTRDGHVWSEDAIEWFIDTKNNGGGAHTDRAYMLVDDYHGIVNILNTKYDSQGTSYGSPSSLWNAEWQSAVRLNRTNNNTDSGYNIEIKIPWKMIGYTTSPSDETIVAMSFALNDKDAQSLSHAMWLVVTTSSWENASKWQQVLLSGNFVKSAGPDTLAPSVPTGLKVILLNE